MIKTIEIIEQAEKFYDVSKECIGMEYNNGWYVGNKELTTEEVCRFLFPKETITATVNLSFCCELLLKSMLNQGEKIKQHNLKMLFYKLDPIWQNIIKLKINKYDNNIFNLLLKDISNCFEKWRYIYEYKPSERSIQFSFLNEFGIVLMSVAHSKYFYEHNEYNKIKTEDLKIIESFLKKEVC